MTDISKEIKAFQDAVYGEEVRGSMISLAEKVNTEVEAGTEKVTEYGKSESARAQAEKDRVTAENLRKSAETKRAQDFAAMQQESEDATDAANTAASNANSKASLANTAAGAANTAAGAANTAASGANAAKQTALQAAAEAEEATEAANTAASNANSKASLANTAAGSANTAADRANKAAEAAERLVLGDISGKTVTFEMALQRANIQSNDSLAVAFGKLAKLCADLDDHAFSAPVPNLLSDDSTKSLAASMGKALKTDIGDLTQLPTTAKGSLVEAITEQNSALSALVSGLDGGKVIFDEHTYNAGTISVDGSTISGTCTLIYMRIYGSNHRRSIFMGTMISTNDSGWFSKYVTSPKLLIAKNIEDGWYGWYSVPLGN